MNEMYNLIQLEFTMKVFSSWIKIAAIVVKLRTFQLISVGCMVHIVNSQS